MIKKLFTAFIALYMGTSLAFATSVPEIPKPDYLPGPESEDTTDSSGIRDYFLNETIPQAINIGIGLLGIAAFIGLLIGSIQMLTAFGNEEKLNKAKTIFRYSILGFVIIILSYAIVSIVVSVALPSSDEAETFIPKTYAVDVEDDVDILFPSEEDFIEQHDEQGRISLPDGDLLTEVVPSAITNIFYFFGILIFISLIYGGVFLVIGRGNEEMTTKAKNILIYSMIAIAIASMGYAIIYGIATLDLSNQEGDGDDVYVDPENS